MNSLICFLYAINKFTQDCSLRARSIKNILHFTHHHTLTSIHMIFHFIFLVHPCDKVNKGGCSQICNKRKDLHVCSCKAGFVLAKDKTTCNIGEKI